MKNNIPAVQESQSEHEGTEHITVKIILPNSEVTIVNCYCPPDKNLGLHHIPTSEKELLILGDFNSHSPSWGYDNFNNRGEQIEDWLTENQLILINKPDDKPTHFSRAWKSTSHPDLGIATDDIHKTIEKSVEGQLGGSDHLPIIYRIETTDPPEIPRRGASWNYKKADWKKFAEMTNKFSEEAKINKEKNLNENVAALTDAILRAAYCSIPRGRRKDYQPFWSPKLQQLHNQLDDARQKQDENPIQENIAAHNTARDEYDEEKTKTQVNSWYEKTESLAMEKEHTKLWRLTKAINEDNQSRYSSTVLTENNTHHTGKMAANILADNFSTESLIEVPRDRAAEVRSQTRLIKTATKEDSPVMITEFSIQELQDACGKLRSKKSPGKDGITNEMIRNLGKTALQTLLDVYNQSWNSGEFPAKWKEAILIPILKKGKDKNQKGSYRPISLLSCLGKTMERMVNKRLQNHLERNGLLDPTQSGFRKNRSTEDQIAYLTQEIENAFQRKMKTIAVFVDLSKAFDKVWKEGLLLKLAKKEVEGNMYRWIESYLFNRSARVKIDGHLSHLVKIKEGVPQGGVISPTLFTVFIDDIAATISKHVSRALHADDLAIWSSSEHITTATYRIQEALNKISQWAKDWLVVINKTKTEATCFSLSTVKEKFTLKLDEEELPQQSTPTFLGVTLNRTLTWKPHIEKIEKKELPRKWES